MNLNDFYQTVDRVKWSKYEDAYGIAEDVPQIVKGLLSAKPEEREEAQGAMYSHLCHQGSVYSATTAVVPLLLQVLQGSETPEDTKIFILEFLKDVGGFSKNQYEELQADYPESDDFAVYQKCAEGFSVYVQIFEKGSKTEQILAARLLGSMFSHRDELIPRFIEILKQSQDPILVATALFSLAQLGGEQASSQLTQELSSSNPFRKLCGTLALCSCLGEKTPTQVIPILLESLSVPKNIEEQYEQIPWSDWPLPVEIAAALSMWGPSIGDQVLPTLLQKFKTLDAMSSVALGRYMLALSLGKGELPFSSLWPDVLLALADHEKFWEFNVNAHEVLDDWNLRPDQEMDPSEMEIDDESENKGLTDEEWQQFLRGLAIKGKQDPKRDENMQEFIHRQM